MNNENEGKTEDKSEEDCPAELIQLFDASKSEWRKAIIKQFIELHEWRQAVTRKLSRISLYEKIIIVILSIIGTAIIQDMVVPILLEYLAIL